MGSRQGYPWYTDAREGTPWGGPQHDPQCDKRAQLKRQTPLSLTTYIVAEPCSVQFSSARIQQRTEQVVQRRQEVDGQFVGSRKQQRQRKHTETRLALETTQTKSEKLIEKVQNEELVTSRGRRTVPSSEPA